MSTKTTYKVWFVIGALYLLGAIYPLAVRDRNWTHRRVLIVMGLVWIGVGMNFKKKYEKQLAPAVNPTPRD